jgi:molecular chaperone DnaK (HSP70)
VSGVTVVVDFGATDTVSVLRRNGDLPRPLAVDGETSVPSAVALSPSDQLVVGREAVDQDRVVRNLRNRLDRTT